MLRATKYSLCALCSCFSSVYILPAGGSKTENHRQQNPNRRQRDRLLPMHSRLEAAQQHQRPLSTLTALHTSDALPQILFAAAAQHA